MRLSDFSSTVTAKEQIRGCVIRFGERETMMIGGGQEIQFLIKTKTVTMCHFQIILWLPVNEGNVH